MESDVLVERLEPLAQARAVALPRRVSLALAVAGALVIAWLLVAPSSPDLAAQVYRVRLLQTAGFSVWDGNWYGGHHLPGYSLLFPWMAVLLGMRLVGALAVLASTWAFERIVLSVYGPRARWGAAFFALAATGDLWIGRLTFALGVAFGVLAVLALVRLPGKGGLLLAGACAALCAASSPVAGAFLALAGVTDAVARRRLWPGLALVVAVAVVMAPVELLFPEGGTEPYGFKEFAACTAVTLAFLWAAPRRERLLRTGGVLFLLADLLALLPTPMGSNVARYPVLLAGPLVLCALARQHAGESWRPRRLAWRRGDGRRLANAGVLGRPPAAVAALLAGIAGWVVWGPVVQADEVLRDPSTQAAYYRPLRAFLETHARGPVRVEVPFTRSHWEAALLAPYVPLARGWERQLDRRYDHSIEADPLVPGVYEAWLQSNAVAYVALPDVPLDGSSAGEALLIAKGVPFLREVLHTRHWRVFAVAHPTPLASAPARMTGLGHDWFSLRFLRAGTSLVRVRYTPYWTAISGAACVAPAAGGWTAVTVGKAGPVSIAARFSLEGALEGGGQACQPAPPGSR